ncbi:Ezrin/radixin/moesin family protein [Limibacter armeniacum]|uniref:Ezrin/radixin/moesin family protein n=1 Tax=Limibacter armeniacum TaxID=466084 RepID=UPI002FE63BDC
MRKLILAVVMVVGTIAATTFTAQAQDKKAEKKERKEWKKKLKQMDPLEFRDLTQEVNVLRGQASGLKSEISKLEKQTGSLKDEIQSKNDKISELEQKLSEASSQPKGDDWTKGVVYKVQVGAFKNERLKDYQEKGAFWEEDEDGLKKYTIAHFRDYNEADHFKKYMRAMGIKDAWIVAYENNVRKDIKDALESQQQNAPAQSKKERSRR